MGGLPLVGGSSKTGGGLVSGEVRGCYMRVLIFERITLL